MNNYIFSEALNWFTVEEETESSGLRRVWHCCWWGWGGITIMPSISYSRAPLCSGYWGWQGGVCWVIKLLGCHAAGSSILCSAPGWIWPKVIQQCAWLWWLLLRPRCGAQERGFSLNWTAWRMVEKGECIGNCPEYHHQAYCNVYCLLPSPDYCRAFWEVSILPPPARDSDPCRSGCDQRSRFSSPIRAACKSFFRDCWPLVRTKNVPKVWTNAEQIHYKLLVVTHMGQIPQDGENGQNVAFFLFFWSSAVTKRLFFSTFVNCSEEILSVRC